MCRRDLFKVGLDDTYKAICGSKQPVGLELLGDDLTDRLKTVKDWPQEETQTGVF